MKTCFISFLIVVLFSQTAASAQFADHYTSYQIKEIELQQINATLLDLESNKKTKKINLKIKSLKRNKLEVTKELNVILARLYSIIKKRTEDLENFKIGIYFETKNKASSALAKEIKKALEETNRDTLVALRSKNEAFFERIGLPITNEIRYDRSMTEEKIAQYVQIIIRYKTNVFFFLRTASGNRDKHGTKNFISVFVQE